MSVCDVMLGKKSWCYDIEKKEEVKVKVKVMVKVKVEVIAVTSTTLINLDKNMIEKNKSK